MVFRSRFGGLSRGSPAWGLVFSGSCLRGLCSRTVQCFVLSVFQAVTSYLSVSTGISDSVAGGGLTGSWVPAVCRARAASVAAESMPVNLSEAVRLCRLLFLRLLSCRAFDMPSRSSDSDGTSPRPRRRSPSRSADEPRAPGRSRRAASAEDAAVPTESDDFGSGVDSDAGGPAVPAEPRPTRVRRAAVERPEAPERVEPVNEARPSDAGGAVAGEDAGIRRPRRVRAERGLRRETQRGPDGDSVSESVDAAGSESTDRTSNRFERRLADVESQTGMRYFSTDELDFVDDDGGESRGDRGESRGDRGESRGDRGEPRGDRGRRGGRREDSYGDSGGRRFPRRRDESSRYEDGPPAGENGGESRVSAEGGPEGVREDWGRGRRGDDGFGGSGASRPPRREDDLERYTDQLFGGGSDGDEDRGGQGPEGEGDFEGGPGSGGGGYDVNDGDDRRPSRRRRRRRRRGGGGERGPGDRGPLERGPGDPGQRDHFVRDQGYRNDGPRFDAGRPDGGNRRHGGRRGGPIGPGAPRDRRGDNAHRGGQPMGGGRGGRDRDRDRDRGMPRRPRSISPSAEVIEGTFEGVVELHNRGYGFLRDPKRNYAAEDSNPFVSSSLVEKYRLREGVLVRGEVGAGTHNQGPRLLEVETIDGLIPEDYDRIRHFDQLTAINPFEQIRLETGPKPLTMRVMDLLCPIGKGQRALLVAPPRTGKTMLLQDIAHAVSVNHPEIHLMVLLIDERPEEVTEMRRLVKGEVISSSLDNDVESHIRIAQLIIERAKRLAEEGKDVFILLDSITRLARAFNKYSNTGRTATGGLDIRALDVPKKLFGQARRFDEGGSLTVCGTALIDTGSRMDEAIFQEFKGTGNMEMMLSRELADRRIWPSIDITRSGTRREEKILAADLLEGITMLRRSLISLSPVEAMEQLTKTMDRFPTNREFLTKIRAIL